jgi:hypothetical protein
MKPTMYCTMVGSMSLLAAVAALAAPADDSKKKPEAGLIIIDAKGKEHKLTSWQFIAGTRRLSWLAPAEPEKKEPDKEPKKEGPGKQPARPTPKAQGPQALVFRDDKSTATRDAEGVTTLTPLEYIRGIDFDDDNKTMSVRVATGDKEDTDVVLTGTTRFRGVNKVDVEAEVDKGDLGIAAVKFAGGVPGGIKGIRFPKVKPAPAPKGQPAVVVVNYQEKTEEKVHDLQVLYRTRESEKVSPILFFKKTIKLDLGKVHSLATTGTEGTEWKIKLKNGDEETFTLLKTGELDGKLVGLVGFVARVPAGYRLYPPHTVSEIRFEQAKGDEKP